MKKTIFRSETPPFVMELPTYKIPSPRVVLHRAYDRGQGIRDAGRHADLRHGDCRLVRRLFPRRSPRAQRRARSRFKRRQKQRPARTIPRRRRTLKRLDERQNELGSRLIEESFLGHLGHAIEPAVRPLGWDWRIGVGAIASFPAREVIIATLGTIYSLGSDVDESNQGLIDSLRNAHAPDGTKVYNVPVALSIMVFFALCVSVPER